MKSPALKSDFLDQGVCRDDCQLPIANRPVFSVALILASGVVSERSKPVLYPSHVIFISRYTLHQFVGCNAFEGLRRLACAQCGKRAMHGLHRGHEWLVALKANAYVARTQVWAIE